MDLAAKIYNFFEMGLWLTIGTLFLIHAFRKATRKGHASAAGIAFIIFGITDIIEIVTGAWWDPWWLLTLNMICIFFIIMLFLTYKPPFSTAVTVLVVPFLFALCYFKIFPEPPETRIFYFLSRAWLILFPAAWTLWGEKKKFPFPRFKKNGIGAGIASGLCIGLVMLVMYIQVFKDLLPAQQVQARADALGFRNMWFFLFAGFLVFMNSALEEYYWRWFAYSQTRKLCKGPAAITLTSAGFALHHIIILVIFFGWLWGYLFGVGVAVGGAIWSHHYEKYDSIWPAFISHAIVDAAIMLIGFYMLFCQ